MTKEFEELAAKLDELGEAEVRVRLAHGVWVERNKRFIEEWLRNKEAQRAAATGAARDAREEAMLSTAQEANSIARQALSNWRAANRLVAIAILLSAAMAIKEVIPWLSSH